MEIEEAQERLSELEEQEKKEKKSTESFEKLCRDTTQKWKNKQPTKEELEADMAYLEKAMKNIKNNPLPVRKE